MVDTSIVDALYFAYAPSGLMPEELVHNGVVLIEHWDGTAWQLVPGANPGVIDNGLFAVASIPGSQEFWAVGRQTSTPIDGPPVYSTLIERWDGTQWHAVPSPNVPGDDNELYGVVALSPTDAWVVGQHYNPITTSVIQTLIEHWDGSTWSIVQSPNPSSRANFLASIAASSPTDVWAVGHIAPDFGIQQSATLALHWDGSIWSVVQSPNPGQTDNVFSGISVRSASDAWAVGTFDSIGQNPVKALVAHWDGINWTAVNAPNPGSSQNVLTAVVALSSNLTWAVGYFQQTNALSRTLSERWNGQKWIVVKSPNAGPDDNNFNAISQLPGTDHFLAVGLHFNPDNGTQGTLAAFHC